MQDDLVYGIHAVKSLLQNAPRQAVELYCQLKPNNRLQQVIDLAHANAIKVSRYPRDRLSEICGSERHQGCVLLTRGGDVPRDFEQCLAAVNPQSLFLVLDGVQDPHNLGACLRSADACGVDAVIIPRDRAVGLNATVRKVAAGAADSVPLITVTNLARSLQALKRAGVWIYGSDDGASDSLYDFDYRGPLALVMGAEGKGLRRLTLDNCDYLLRLPMLGQVESLNVSVATGVCLYEILRSRNAAQSK